MCVSILLLICDFYAQIYSFICLQMADQAVYFIDDLQFNYYFFPGVTVDDLLFTLGCINYRVFLQMKSLKETNTVETFMRVTSQCLHIISFVYDVIKRELATILSVFTLETASHVAIVIGLYATHGTLKFVKMFFLID